MESLRPRIAAVIPVLDEEGAIGAVIGAIPRAWVDEIIVVDGGSRDGTAEAARDAGARVLVEMRRGYGRACAKGAEAAIAGGAGILVFLDGDGGDRPEAIPQLLEPIFAGECDFVVGARVAATIGAHQAFAGRSIGALVGLLYGVRYTDMCAFRAIRADAFLGLGMRETTYGWNLEMQMRAARARLRIREVGVPPGRRLAGRAKVAGTLSGSLKAGWRILATFARIARERG
ncbi:MAG TPA: glycosyltransferase family 2 protein [Stellaceae bacterium]